MGPSSNPQLAEQNLESNPDQVIHTLLEAFAASIRSALPKTNLAIAHCWRYARSVKSERTTGFLHHAESKLSLIGDWLHDGRVEGAFLSGWEAAEAANG
jgi:predicted NAD/FAD-dependent oxidoreductase